MPVIFPLITISQLSLLGEGYLEDGSSSKVASSSEILNFLDAIHLCFWPGYDTNLHKPRFLIIPPNWARLGILADFIRFVSSLVYHCHK